jgi:iron complex outermembrane receptor protein
MGAIMRSDIRIKTILALMATTALSIGLHGNAFAQNTDKKYFDIPAEDLGLALTQAAQQGGRDVIFSADLARGKPSAGVHGQMTLTDALEHLLAGKGLAARVMANGTIVIEATPVESTTVSEVIVVGSRDGGHSNFDSLSPVSAVGRTQIEHSAALPGETGSIISSFVPSFEFPRFSNDGAADVVRAGQLRGLKPDQTLVLINGKRAHTTAVFAVEGGNGQYTAPFDFNTLPTNAISRVEVLSDGAGAQYGSDAIAGVLNIVLDRSEGGQMSLTYGQHHTQFEPTRQSLDDGGTVTLNGDYGWRFGDKGFFHVGLEAVDRKSSNRAGYTQDANGVRGPIPFDANPYLPNSAQNTAVALAGRVMSAGDGANTGVNAFFNGEYQLSSDWRAYGFGTLSYRSSEGDAFFRWPADWGGDGPDGNRNPGPAYPNGYRPLTHGENTDYGLTGGARSTLAGWDADLSLTVGANDFDWGVKNSLNPSLGTASPHSFHLYSASLDQVTANADFVRRFDIGFSAPLVVATGAEFRHEAFSTSAGDAASYTSGPLIEPIGAEAGPGLRPEDASHVSRDVGGVYLDLTSQMTSRLRVDAAARYDSYSDFGDTVNGKLAARYELLDGLALRGAVSSNYRAPSLAQLGSQTSAQTFNSSATGLLTTLTVAPGGSIAKALGFSDLKPEKSTNYSAGLVWKWHGLDVSLDGYQIDLTDALAVYPQISGSAVQAYLLTKTGRAIQSVQLLQNLAAYTRTGFDLSANYRFAALGGDAELGMTATTGKSRAGSSSFSVPTVLQGLGYHPLPYQTTVSRFGATMKTIVHGAWTNGDWSLFARATRWDEDHLAIRRTSLFQTLPAAWTFDLDVTKKLTRNISVSAGGQNIFDQYPDRQVYADTYYGGLPYSNSQMGFLGGFYYVKIKYALK